MDGSLLSVQSISQAKRQANVQSNPDLLGPLNISGPKRHTLDPYVTGTSVVGIKYNEGVLLAADTLGSYGSLARFRQISRLHALGDVLIGASGDLSDDQFILKDLEALRVREFAEEDGMALDAREIWSYMTRWMYNRRNKFDPLYNQLVLAGCRDGKPFLAMVDLHGTSFEDNTIATGYGGYLARPLLRNAWDEKNGNLTKDEAQKVVEESMRVLFYRDCRTINKIQFATVTQKGVSISEPRELSTMWEFRGFVKTADEGSFDG